MGCSIQQVLKDHFEQFRQHHKQPAHFMRAAYKMMNCRTAALGGHVQECPNGHGGRIWYNSCKHRSCPQCNGLATERWLQKQQARLLNCPHYHIIFTIPHEYNVLWQYNPTTIMKLLFDVAKDCLFDFLRDSKYLGAEPGMLANFHSWGRDQSIHPHVHFLVTAGGLSSTGEWVKPRRSHFLPVVALMIKFRGKFNACLKQLLNDLNLPPEKPKTYWINQVNRLGRKKWNLRLCSEYACGVGVVKYLARYVRGGPFNNQQIVALDRGKVVFRYYDHRDDEARSKQGPRETRFSVDEFIRRCLVHVPETRKQVIRFYGLYAHRATDALNLARRCHFQAPVVKAAEALDWQIYLSRFTDTRKLTHCQLCDSRLVLKRRISPARGPPC